MKKNSLVTHFIKTIDKVFLGFEEINELDVLPENSEQERVNEDEFNAVRSEIKR